MAGSLNFLCGPLSSILCDRFGCRRVAFAGALLSVTGLFLTSLVTRLHYMYITYGLLWGIGSSFSFVPSIVMLGDYFDRRLALANGLGTSGSGVGSLVASPAINYSLRAVGWKNSLRILSGVAAFLAVACVLYRPFKTTRQRDRNGVKTQCSKLCDVSIWKNRTYVAWVLTIALFQFGYPVPFVHLVSLYVTYFLVKKQSNPGPPQSQFLRRHSTNPGFCKIRWSIRTFPLCRECEHYSYMVNLDSGTPAHKSL